MNSEIGDYDVMSFMIMIMIHLPSLLWVRYKYICIKLFLQVVKLSGRWHVPLAVVYSTIQANSLAVFLQYTQKRSRHCWTSTIGASTCKRQSKLFLRGYVANNRWFKLLQTFTIGPKKSWSRGKNNTKNNSLITHTHQLISRIENSTSDQISPYCDSYDGR